MLETDPGQMPDDEAPDQQGTADAPEPGAMPGETPGQMPPGDGEKDQGASVTG